MDISSPVHLQNEGAIAANRVTKQIPKGRRSRVPLSCDPCRMRKLKCNREKPCQNCTARDEQSACNFKGSKNGSTSTINRDGNGDAMKQRIDHLESLVKRLINDKQQEQASPKNVVFTPESEKSETGLPTTAVASDISDVAGAGSTVIDSTHSVYTGGDDWHDVLQEINELKNIWSQTQDDLAEDTLHPNLSHTVDGSSLLFGQVKPIERIEILSTLPPKPEVDKLISRFFDHQNFPITVPPILHIPTFMREYNEHWKDPSQTNFIWLGLLFSILGITMLSYHQFGEPPEYEGISESLFQLYRIRTAQCLLSGDIAKCLPYTVETLRFNATAELNRKDDNRRGLWIMTGVIVRAAINMGYHRDPSHSSSITPLQAEYRRRIWLSVISMDDMTSFLGGFPRMMSAIYSDTIEPRNLHEWELADGAAILPPSRSLTEPTQVTYLIVKGRLCRALGRVADFNATPSLVSYDTVLEIDNELCETYENFPPHMKLPGSTPNFSILSLASMYHKAMCTLHRKSMAKAALDPRYKFSRNRCICSAIALLDYQNALQPSWYKVSRTRQMLTFAAMVLLLELELRQRIPEINLSPDSSTLLQKLQRSCALWKEAKDSCDEASRVHNILVDMLSPFQQTISPGTGSSQSIITPESFDLPGFNPQFPTLNAGLSFDKDLSNVDIDWATWDAFIDEASFEDGPIY